VFVPVWRSAIVVAVVGSVLAAGNVWAQAAPSTAALSRLPADIAEARRRYAEGEKILQSAPPDDGERASLRARAAQAMGRDQDAETILKTTVARQPVGDAALELALLLQRLGRKDEARRLLVRLVDLPDSPGSRDLVRAGRAARALGRYKEANDALREAVNLQPDDAVANTAWGDLFLEKYNREEAVRCYKAALSSDPRDVDAMLGLARAMSDDDFSAALASVRQAVEVNPNSADAHVLLADLLLDAGYADAAREAAGRALSINPRAIQAHALLAAVAYLDNRPANFESALGHALAINGTYGEAYRVVAAQLAQHYRFDDAVVMARKAVALDPDNVRARAELGMDLMRTGDEGAARAALKQAFDVDPYDVITYNLLALLDTLDTFDTVRDADLVVRLDPKESAVLREPVLALANDALKTLSARYGFTPKGPILVEVFPHHDDFAVRNLGIPGLVGALGACFGRVVTIDSPKARPPGTFEWGATLWHELTHVVTLQMSNQRVPRWLTEGISVYEEQRARPEWRRPMEAAFVRALAADVIPPIRQIEGSFADPRTVSLAYYQAGLVVGYLVDTYGQAKFNALVRSFADGLSLDAALVQAFGAGLDRVQAGFDQSIERSFGQLRRALVSPMTAPVERASLDELRALASQHPGSYEVQHALGLALHKEGDLEGATAALGRAASLFPSAIGDDSPHAVLADIATERGDAPAALDEMAKRLAQDPVNLDLARHMAGIMAPDQEPVLAQRVYERIVALDPFDSAAHAKLGRMAVQRGDAGTAIREYQAAVAGGGDDVAAVRCDLAEAYLLAGDAARAKREALAVLERLPTYERAQELLLKIVGGDR
jgi:tetratricopeptide (TPR) repeat protein